MKIKHGVTRTVFIFKNIVIKIPILKYKHFNFLSGCVANSYERKFTKQFKNHHYADKIAPTLYNSIFGLFAIQKRATLLTRFPTDDEIQSFQGITTDIKQENFGYIDNMLVCIDYA